MQTWKPLEQSDDALDHATEPLHPHIPVVLDDENVWRGKPDAQPPVVPPTHEPYEPQKQVESQVRVLVPPPVHAALSVAPGVHTPSPPHTLQPDQPVARHERVRVPHLPQTSDSVAPSVPQGGAPPMQSP